MKNRLNRTLMLTAAVLTLGAAAYGQYAVTAKVPFSFHIKGAELSAGDYTVAQEQGPILKLRESVSGKTVMSMTKSRATEIVPRGARLVFKCGDLSGCALAEVWNDSGYGWNLVTPHFAAIENERVAVIFMNRTVGQ